MDDGRVNAMSPAMLDELGAALDTTRAPGSIATNVGTRTLRRKRFDSQKKSARNAPRAPVGVAAEQKAPRPAAGPRAT